MLANLFMGIAQFVRRLNWVVFRQN